MANRIIFLDIDGPVIPISCYYINRNCSFDRNPVSTIAIGELLRLIELSGAKIVYNTTHNRNYDKLRADLHWLAPHVVGRTNYPDVARHLAVTQWLSQNQCDEWVAFDDVKFTGDPRLIHIDVRLGINADSVDQVLKMWGIEDKAIFLI